MTILVRPRVIVKVPPAELDVLDAPLWTIPCGVHTGRRGAANAAP